MHMSLILHHKLPI